MASDPSRDESQDPDKQVAQILAEAHMILPGVLSLLGLQIIAVMNPVFQDELEKVDHVLHLVALVLLALGAALVMTPAAYHRQVAPYAIPNDFIKIATIFVTLTMIPLMLALAIDVYLVSKLALGSPPVCIAIAGTMLLVFVGLWIVFPRYMCRRRRQVHAEQQRAREAEEADKDREGAALTAA